MWQNSFLVLSSIFTFCGCHKWITPNSPNDNQSTLIQSGKFGFAPVVEKLGIKLYFTKEAQENFYAKTEMFLIYWKSFNNEE